MIHKKLTNYIIAQAQAYWHTTLNSITIETTIIKLGIVTQYPIGTSMQLAKRN